MRRFLFLFMFFSLFFNGSILRKLDEEIRDLYYKNRIFIYEIRFGQFISTGFAFEPDLIVTVFPPFVFEENIDIFNYRGEKIEGYILGWDSYSRIGVVKTKSKIRVPKFSKIEVIPSLVISFSLKGEGSFKILALNREDKGRLYFDGEFLKGFSGAPLFNTQGRVIGMLRGRFYPYGESAGFYKHESVLRYVIYETIGYSYSYILKKVQEIKKKKFIYPGFLGVVVSFYRGGIYVKNVIDNSPAERGGIKEGDYIISFDGIKPVSLRHFIDIVRSKLPGEEVKIVIKREGKIDTLNVIIGKKEYKRDFESIRKFIEKITGHIEE